MGGRIDGALVGLGLLFLAATASALDFFPSATNPTYPNTCPVIVSESIGSLIKVYTAAGYFTGVQCNIGSNGYCYLNMAGKGVGPYTAKKYGTTITKSFTIMGGASCPACWIGGAPYRDGVRESQGSLNYCNANANPYAWSQHTLTNVAISPPSATVQAGGTVSLTATAYDETGTAVNAQISWSADGGSVSPSTGRSVIYTAPATPGTYEVTATATANGGSVQATATITVTAGQLAYIIISPSAAQTVAAGETLAFTATGYDAAGNVVPINPTWSVTGGIGTVNPATGASTTFTATTVGSGTIRASQGSITSPATPITVVPGAPASLVLSAPQSATVGTQFIVNAALTDAYGNPVADGTSVTFELSNPVGSQSATTTNGVASVTFTAATSTGSATIRAYVTSNPSVQDSATIDYIAGPLASLFITPSANQSVTVGETIGFVATGTDAYGNAVAVNPTWVVTGGIGSVDPATGASTTFTATTVGSGTVYATESGVDSNIVNIQVNPGAAASITLTVVPPSVQVGGVPFSVTAEVRDAYGNAVADGTNISFTLTNPPSASSALTVNGQASVTFYSANQTGTETVTAYVTDNPAVQSATTVDYTPGPIAYITLEPFNPAPIEVGQQIVFTARAFDAWGNEITAFNPVWYVIGAGTVNPTTGPTTTYNATAPGTDRVVVNDTATSVFNQTDVVVTGSSVPARIEFVSVPASVPVNGSAIDIVVAVYDANGFPVADGVPVAFQLTHPDGFVDTASDTTAGGQARAIFYSRNRSSPPDAVVNVTSGSAQNATTLTITPGPLASIDVQVANSPLRAGDSTQVTASGFDAWGNPVAANPSWSVTGNAGTFNPLTGPTTTFTAQVVGSWIITANDSGIVGSAPIEITAGAPYTIIITAPSLTTPDTNVSVTAEVFDQFGNTVPDAVVVFNLTESPLPEGNLSNGTDTGSVVTALTNVAGIADITLWTSPTPGNHTINASVDGISNSTRVETLATVGNIDGYVLSTTGLPVAGALVVVDGTSFNDTTGGTGYYFIGGLAEGTYSLTATRAGFEPGTASGVVVVAGSTTQANITMQQHGGIIGYVTDAGNGSAIAGANVSAWQGLALIQETLTDSFGFYFLSDLVAGIYNLTVTAQNYLSASALDVSVQPGANTTQNFSLVYNDTTPPIVQLVPDTPADGANVTGTIVLNATASDPNLDTIELLANGAVVASCTGTTVCTAIVNTAAYPDGNGTLALSARANDTFGNIGVSGTRTLTVDNIPPAVAFVEPHTPANNSNVSGVIFINFTASDEPGITSAQLWINDALNATITYDLEPSVTGSFTINTTYFGDGPLSFQVVANGIFTTNGTEVRTVNVNTSAPPVFTYVVVEPAYAEMRAGESIDFNATALDQYMQPIGGVTFTWSASGGSIDAQGNFTAAVVGLYTITATGDNGTTQINGTATANVTPAAAANLTVVAAPPVVAPGENSTITATLTDAFGNAIAGATIDFDLTLTPLPAGSLNASSATTNASGQAQVLLTTSTNVSGGVHTVQARYGSLNASVNVTATGTLGNLEGYVRSNDGTPINGASVVIEGTGYSATTNASGYYIITGVAPSNSYAVTASAAGYLDQTVTGVSVQAGQTTWLNFTLTQLGTISGTVTESDGTPIAGVNVSVDGTGRWALTDGSGNYAIQVEPGTYSLTATKAGYATQRRSGVVVTAGGVSDVDMIMYRLGGFIGVVVDGITGAPIPGTLVEAIQGGSVIGSDTTNAAGQYSIPNLPAGLYDVRATTPLGQSQTSFNEMIVAGQNTTVNFAFI